jgi:hypothetical protein
VEDILDAMCLHDKHILLLTETWTTKNSMPPHVPGYTLFHVPGRVSRGRSAGGICVYVSENISHLVQQCGDHCTAEKLWVKVSAEIGTPNDIYLGVCYYPPKGSTFYRSMDGQDHNPFASLEVDLEHFRGKGNVLLAGDFNARTTDLPDTSDDSALCQHIPCLTSELLGCHIPPMRKNSDVKGEHNPNYFGRLLTDLTQVHSLVICNGRLKGDEAGTCTHRSANTGHSGLGGFSLVDYFIADPELYSGSLAGMKVRDHEKYYESDHTPLDIFVNLSPKESCSTDLEHPCKPSSIKFKISTENIPDFQQVLAGASQDLVCFCNLDTTSPDEALKSIHNVVMQAAGFTFQKVSPHKHVPNRSKPWFDTECKHIKLNYLSLVKLQSPPEIIKSARREFRTLVRYKRRKYKEAQGNRLCSLATQDAAKFWKAFKTKPMSLKITDRATWFTHFHDLLQAPKSTLQQENQQLPPAAAITAAATSEITLDTLRRDFKLITMKYSTGSECRHTGDRSPESH